MKAVEDVKARQGERQTMELQVRNQTKKEAMTKRRKKVKTDCPTKRYDSAQPLPSI